MQGLSEGYRGYGSGVEQFGVRIYLGCKDASSRDFRRCRKEPQSCYIHATVYLHVCVTPLKVLQLLFQSSQLLKIKPIYY